MIPLKDNIPKRGQLPYVTVVLILINVIVFVFFEHSSPSLGAPSDSKVVKYRLIPYEFAHPGKECDLRGRREVEAGHGHAPGGSEQRGGLLQGQVYESDNGQVVTAATVGGKASG